MSLPISGRWWDGRSPSPNSSADLAIPHVNQRVGLAAARSTPARESDSSPTQSIFAALPFQTASTSSLPRRGMPFSLMSGSVASSIALRRKTSVSV